MGFLPICLIAFLLISCNAPTGPAAPSPLDTIASIPVDSARPVFKPVSGGSSDSIITGSLDPQELLAFSKTLLGVPYLYASTDPLKGFDCSGFITYIFTHFNIHVPRSSIDFTDKGREVSLEQALPGDLILFSGTDSAERFVGHMGLVEGKRNDSLYFIHSTSGKAKGVVITAFGNYYAKRFVKVIRVFPDFIIEKESGIEKKDSSILTQ